MSPLRIIGNCVAYCCDRNCWMMRWYNGFKRLFDSPGGAFLSFVAHRHGDAAEKMVDRCSSPSRAHYTSVVLRSSFRAALQSIPSKKPSAPDIVGAEGSRRHVGQFIRAPKRKKTHALPARDDRRFRIRPRNRGTCLPSTWDCTRGSDVPLQFGR